MNYRHAYHAGNFADVVKHAVLCRVLVHLREKPAAFRVIDTHAGAGRYDLAGPEAGKTGEWRDGIGRLRRADARRSRCARCSRPISTRSRRSIRAARSPRYPGSPALVQALLRPQDRLIACELEPQAAAALERDLRGDRARQGDRDRRLDRARRLCAAEGAARPGADRSAVRAAGRILPAGARAWKRRTASGRPASTCSGTRSRTRPRSQPSPASSPGSASRRCCAWNC